MCVDCDAHAMKEKLRLSNVLNKIEVYRSDCPIIRTTLTRMQECLETFLLLLDAATN